MRDQILSLIRDKYELSGGHCGTYAVDLCHGIGRPYHEVKAVLNALYREGLIRVHDGSRGSLVMLNKPKNKGKNFNH